MTEQICRALNWGSNELAVWTDLSMEQGAYKLYPWPSCDERNRMLGPTLGCRLY